MQLLDDLLEQLTQTEHSGGMHTAPELRLLLLLLARMHRAQSIIETGYDAGYTTLALSWSGAEVLATDNLSEYLKADETARLILKGRDNVTLVNDEALDLLKRTSDASIDLIFVDDQHEVDHVRQEGVEVRRILKPGGIAVFHDTIMCNLRSVVDAVFSDWPKIYFSAFGPGTGFDYGFGIVRKP